MPINEEDQVDIYQSLQSSLECLKPYIVLANNTPQLLWLLYDLDLMPEQLTGKEVTDVRDTLFFYTICEAFRLGRESAVKT